MVLREVISSVFVILRKKYYGYIGHWFWEYAIKIIKRILFEGQFL